MLPQPINPVAASQPPGADASQRTGQAVAPQGDAQGQVATNADQVWAEREAALRDSMRQEFEGHVSNVRSQLMSSFAKERADWDGKNSEYQQQLFEANTRGLDENQRNAYEAQVYKQRVQELEGRMSQMADENNALSGIGPYVNGLVQAFDIDPRKLDMSDPNTLMQSGWTVAAQQYRDLQQKYQQLQQQSTVQQPTQAPAQPAQFRSNQAPVQHAPSVVTTAQTAPTAPASSWYDYKISVQQRLGLNRVPSDEEILQWGRDPRTTGIDLNEALPALQAELDKQEAQASQFAPRRFG